MKENSSEQLIDKKELRKMFVEEYLIHLEKRRLVEVGKIATVLHGPFTHIGLIVTEIREDGTVLVLPSPDSKEPVEFKENEIWNFDDYKEAFEKALQKYPFTTKELGVEIPNAMNN